MQFQHNECQLYLDPVSKLPLPEALKSFFLTNLLIGNCPVADYSYSCVKEIIRQVFLKQDSIFLYLPLRIIRLIINDPKTLIKTIFNNSFTIFNYCPPFEKEDKFDLLI